LRPGILALLAVRASSSVRLAARTPAFRADKRRFESVTLGQLSPCSTLSYGGGRWFKSTRRDHHLIAFAAKLPDRKLCSRIRSYDGAQIARNCLSLISIAISSGFVHQLGRLFVEQENSGQHREPGPLRGPQVLFDLELLHRAPSSFNPPPSTGSKSGAYHANPNL
jgi:hypothetical protein